MWVWRRENAENTLDFKAYEHVHSAGTKGAGLAECSY